jgi:hypothetical protein
VKGLCFDVTSNAAFLASDGQGILDDCYMERLRINAWCERFDIDVVTVFVDIHQWVAPGGMPRQKCCSKCRLAAKPVRVKRSINLPA